MAHQKADCPDSRRKWPQTLKSAGAAIKASMKSTMVAIPVVLAVWCAGRLLETLHGHAVFDALTAIRLGAVVGLLLILWLAGLGIRCFHKLKNAPSILSSAFAWGTFFALMAIALWRIEGFQIAASGFLAAVSGNLESSRNATLLLMKYHSANPMLAVNLGAQAFTGSGGDIASLASYAWHWNTQLFLYTWSLAFGIVWLRRSGVGFIKALHLMMSAAGLGTLIILKSKSLITAEAMIIFQAAALLLLLLQVLMIYAFLRRAAAETMDAATEGDERPFGEGQRSLGQTRLNYRGLPPSAMALTLSFFFVLPILADLMHQAKCGIHSRHFAEKVNQATSDEENVRVAVAPPIIRSGPSLGDDILGVPPEGNRLHLEDVGAGRVPIGQNHGVPDKDLRPLVQENRLSRIGSARIAS